MSLNISEFKMEFRDKVVMEWYQAYLNYIQIEKQFVLLKQIYDHHTQQYYMQGNQYLHYLSLSTSTIQKYNQILNFCEQLIKIGQKKFVAFFNYKKNQLIYHCHELQFIMQQLSKSELLTHTACHQRYHLKTTIKLIYANTYYLQQFVSLNNEIIYITTKYIQFVKNLVQHSDNTSEIVLSDLQNQQSSINLSRIRKLSQSAEESIIQKYQKNVQQNLLLQIIQQKMKELYLQLVFHNQEKINRLNQLVGYNQKKNSQKTYILVGLFCGMCLLSFLAIILLLVFGIVTPNYSDQNIDSMLYIFPMFRGVGLLILYLWGIAWNVYGFTRYRINFRKILHYGSHYSTHMIIIKRASFFSLIFSILILLYFIGSSFNEAHHDSFIPIQYTPFIVWLLYLGYIFFPNRQVFNPGGRKYFYRVIKDVILSPIGKMTFLISWLTDQTVSFVIPIKDMMYTICFYTSDFSNNNYSGPENCLDKTSTAGFLVTYLIALFPLIFRMIQCYRQAIQDQKFGNKFIGHLQMWNFGKYLASVLTATLSFVATLHKSFLIPFTISSIISTLYAYFWDLKYDWGFFEKNSKHQFLRNHLSYQKPYFYYIAICINLIFRFSWTLSISSFVQQAVTSSLLPLILGIMQIMRRCMWNFFRIEKQHIMNCRNFAVIDDIGNNIKQIQKKKKININKDGDNFESAFQSQSIPYFYKDSYKNFLLDKIIPQEYEKQITKQILDKQLEQFDRILQKQKLIVSLGYENISQVQKQK